MSSQAFDIASTGFERSLAVVIGINAYSHGIPPLSNAVGDANTVADTLERQGFSVLRFLDEEATLASLSHLLSQILPSLQSPPDRLLVYFAGHGLASTDAQHQFTGFLLPSDARRDDLSSYWPMASLRESLSRLPCRHLLLILDCCFAGAFPLASSRDLRPLPSSTPLFLERFRHFSSRRSFQLLLSTSHDELASDRLLAKASQEVLGTGPHSPFALALLEALAPSSPADFNQDGLLTASELYTFLRDRLVTLLPSQTRQTPTLRYLDWHEGGEFLFLLSDSFPSLPSAASLSRHSNPYLGLRPFSAAHRHLFFGRERVIDSLWERLHAEPLLVLCSPSGTGKSSLVQAGLMPRLAQDDTWCVLPSLRPSLHPLQQLSSCLASLSPHAPSHEELSAQPHRAAECLHAFLSSDPARSVLLVVDPLEELLTACPDDALRLGFLRALFSLLHLSHPRFRLLLVLRSDFEPHLLPLLRASSLPLERWRSSRFLLPPMNREELRRCIQKPAEATLLFFSPGLVERLLDDVEQMPGALPLLSVALSELFDAYLGSGREDRTLSFEDYQQLGDGLAGVLQHRAEVLYAGAPPLLHEGQQPLPAISPQELPAFQRTLRDILLRMVSAGEGELTRRRVPRSELEYPAPEENAHVQRALAALEQSRLVVARDDHGPCVEPAHDALLSAWLRLHQWIRHAQRELLLLHQVSRAASEWLRGHRAENLLWPDSRLDPFRVASPPLHRRTAVFALPLTLPHGQPLEPLAFNAAETEFLHASAARKRALRIRRYSLGAAMVVVLLALGGIIFRLSVLIQAETARASAETARASAMEASLQYMISSVALQKAEQEREEAHRKAAIAQERVAVANAELQRINDELMLALKRARLAKRQADQNAQAARKAEEQAHLAAEKLGRKWEEANKRVAALQTQIDDSPKNPAPWARDVSQERRQAADTKLQEANSLLIDGHHERAAMKYREALDAWDHPAIHYNLALALIGAGKRLEVREHMKLAIRYGEEPLGHQRFEHALALLKSVEQ